MKILAWLKTRYRGQRLQRGLDETSATDPESAMEATDPAVRRRAVRALGEMGGYYTVDRIIAALDDPDDHVRLEAVIALGKIGDPRAVEPLIRKLKSYDYFYVRKKAAYTLYTFLEQENLDDDLRQKIRSHWRSWYLT